MTARPLISIACGSVLLALLSVPSFAQDAGVDGWSGGRVPGEGFGGCAYSKSVGEGVDIVLYANPTTPPRLEVRKADWGLIPTQEFYITLVFDNARRQFEAEQARKLDIVRINSRESEGGTNVLKALAESTHLSIELEGDRYSTSISRIDTVLSTLQSCVDGSATAQSSPQTARGDSGAEQPKRGSTSQFDLGSALSQLPTGRVAVFTCFITTGDLYGILTMRADDPGEFYTIEIFDDATMLFQGTRIAAGHIERGPLSIELQGAAYHVRTLAGAGANYELPSTFGSSGEQFSEFMQEYTQGIGAALLGDRDRWMIINLLESVVAFSDIDADGNLINTVAPDCFRTE